MNFVPDIIAPELKLLFCGINPGELSGKMGYHFAHPSNRFWKVLFQSGLTSEMIKPEYGHMLLEKRIGITNLVMRPSKNASELDTKEILNGAKELEEKIKIYKPKNIAFLGIGAYKRAYDRNARVGKQSNTIAGCNVWLLPNPSGLNAHYNPTVLVELFSELRSTIFNSSSSVS